MHMQVYDGTQLQEVHPTPSMKANKAADAAAAAAEAAVPFVPGRYGAADHSMEEAVKLSHGRSAEKERGGAGCDEGWLPCVCFRLTK